MKCDICESGCSLAGDAGSLCGMYAEKNGKVEERYADNYLPPFPVSIETMPALHFYPNGKFLQVSTMGCNFRCGGCVSRVLIGHAGDMSGLLQRLDARAIVRRAMEEGCRGIAFCINEPLASYHTFRALAIAAKAEGLLMGCSTNAYFTGPSLDGILPYLDFVNVGLKGVSDDAYRFCGVRSATPVLRNLKKLYESGVHVEVATVLYYGREEDAIRTARAVASLSRQIPLQVMKYVPFDDAGPELEPSTLDAEALCGRLEGILDYVYLFNTPGTLRLSTRCPNCGKVVIQRDFAGPMGALVRSFRPGGVCECGHRIPIAGEISPERYREAGFLGGYRLTRGFGMIEAILRCLGITDEHAIGNIWIDVARSGYLNDFYYAVNDMGLYLEAIGHFARAAGREGEGKALVGHIRERLGAIDGAGAAAKRPRALYVMGHPLFAVNATRFENALVERAGGISLNRSIPREGIPGVTITAEEMEGLGPEAIFVSGLFSGNGHDFKRFYDDAGIDVPAVRENRIHYVYPSWDFGSPRWILGLMYMANRLRPDTFAFDVEGEADYFYRKFYGVSFESVRSKRHFSLTRAGEKR